MLYSANQLKGYKLNSLDGDIGKAKEFYFDDKHWTVRYLVADSGNWLFGRTVLLSPYSLVSVKLGLEEIEVALSKKQIEGSPALESDKPVSLQYEESYYGYYGWPQYWAGPNSWGPYPYATRDSEKWKEFGNGGKKWDRHLRSTREVEGYHVQATDGSIGHISDFIIDDETWAIRYLVVNTHNWLPGRKTIVSPLWTTRVSWVEKKVYFDLTKATIEQSPELTKDALITRDYESRLAGFYNRNGYWSEELINS